MPGIMHLLKWLQVRSRLVHFEQEGVIYTPDPQTLTLVHHYESGARKPNEDNHPLAVHVIAIVTVAAVISVLSISIAAVSLNIDMHKNLKVSTWQGKSLHFPRLKYTYHVQG